MKLLLPTLLLLALTLPCTRAQSLLTNGDLEADPYDSGWTAVAAGPFGGLAPGSMQSASIAGTTTTTQGTGRIGQPLPGAAANWQLDFYFALKNTNQRAFSLFVATSNVADSATINLRYQSGQFNTFSAGSFGADLGLGTVSPSTDANEDGDFDDPGDVKNVYRMRLTGNGWGTGNGTYDIQLSNANQSTFSRNVTGLNRYQNGSGHAAVPQSILFNSLFGLNPGFWVDDVTFENIALPDDPNLAVVTPLPIFGTLPLDSGTTSRTLTVGNTGSANPLTLTGATVSGTNAAAYSVSSTLPLVIPPGATGDITIDFNSGLSRGAFSATLNLLSNDTSSASIPVALPAMVYSTGDSFLTNGSFEADPFTTAWVPVGAVSATPGLRADSPVSASLAGPGTGGLATTLGQSVIGTPDWQLEFDLLIPPATGRSFQLLIHNFGEASRQDAAPVMIRYENDAFGIISGTAFVDQPALGQMLASLDNNGDGDYDDAGDLKNVYRIQVIGRGWGTPEATYDIGVTEANSGVFSRFLTRLKDNQSGLGSMFTSPPSAFLFSSVVNNNPGYTVDNIVMTAGAPPQSALYEPVAISGNPAGVTLTWPADGFSSYRIWISPDLGAWAILEGGLFGPEFTDAFAPNRSKRFYRVEKE